MGELKIKVLLVDDHRIVREGIKSLIDSQSDMEVIAEASSGREAIRIVRKMSPDLVVMDVAMPDMNGIEATRHITSEFPGVKVIALSMHSNKRFVVEILRVGASGYLLKDCAFEELANAIRAVMAGELYLSSKVASLLIKEYIRGFPKDETSAFGELTPREREVLQLIAEGKSTKQIASILHVSVKTVETHRRQIMNKLELYTVAELTKYAIREGITSLEV